MKTIRGKMLLRFGGVLSVFLFLAGGVMYWQSRAIVVPLTEHLSQEVLMARSAEMSRLMEGYLRDVRFIAGRSATRSGERSAIRDELDFSMALMDGGDYEMLFFADTAGRFFTTTNNEGNVGDREYFQAVIADGAREFISDPVVSRASGEHVFVVACPVDDERGETIGLIGATVLLETLSSIAAGIEIGQSGFGYLVDRNGLLIAHPDREWRLKLNLLESAKMGFVGLDEVGRKMIAGESGFHAYSRPDGSRLVTVYHPIDNTPGWSLGIALGKSELLGPADRLMRTVVGLMIVIIAFVLLVVCVISGNIAAPIQTLLRGVKTVGTGNLDEIIEIRTGDEIEQLAQAFTRMKTDLKEYMENLRRTTAEKERIDRDLHVANRIQSSMLPRLFPPFPDIDNLDIYAAMEPAREVGGDFYDFFLIDDRRLCFSIGDVSGKGVSAALFMVITRTILKNQALQGNPLPEIMRNTNAMLCAENDESMFVTVFMGVLDVLTGELEYVCAGHNPPLISRSGKDFNLLAVKPNLVLGGMEDSVYPSLREKLAPDDLLFLYTDGVTEAMNSANKLFGDDRMISAANALGAGRHARSVISAVRSAVKSYVQDTPASDDVTMLALGLKDSV